LSGPGLNASEATATRIRLFLDENRALLNWRVLLAGDVPPAEVEKLVAQASCIVLPSTYEGFGLPLAEALSFGKPVICSDIPPFREQLARYGCEALATLVPPDNARAIEDAMAAHLAAIPPAIDQQDLEQRLRRWTWADTARRCRILLEKAHG
ncbi:MAG TPA: glycosyltransferase, partial [Chthoniobacteraceae bacterium]|nr:glycosyltransferase [Chthoniobacteraceae bacterium]